MSVSIYFVLCSPELSWDCYADALCLGPYLVSIGIQDKETGFTYLLRGGEKRKFTSPGSTKLSCHILIKRPWPFS